MRTLHQQVCAPQLSFEQSIILVSSEKLTQVRLLLTQNPNRARALCKKYACQNDLGAQNLLGILYTEAGQLTKAAFWFQKAAGRLPAAACNLAKVRLLHLKDNTLTVSERRNFLTEACHHVQAVKDIHPEAAVLWQQLKWHHEDQEQLALEPLEFDAVSLTDMLDLNHPSVQGQQTPEEAQELADLGYETSDNYTAVRP